MYNLENLKKDIVELEALNELINLNIKDIQEAIEKKEVSPSYKWINCDTSLAFHEYKELTKKINLQDIYAVEDTEEEKTKKILNQYKDDMNKNYQLFETFESLSPEKEKYEEMSNTLTEMFQGLQNLNEIDDEHIENLVKKISNYILTKDITIPKIDEEFEYIDIILSIAMNIDDEFIQSYLNELDNKLEELDSQNGNFISEPSNMEIGLETFDKQIEEDENDLNKILRDIKKENNF